MANYPPPHEAPEWAVPLPLNIPPPQHPQHLQHPQQPPQVPQPQPPMPRDFIPPMGGVPYFVRTMAPPEEKYFFSPAASVTPETPKQEKRAPRKTPKHTKLGALARPVRTRSATACEHCRLKKIKCDNARPRCGSCRLNEVECVYGVDTSDTRESTDAILAKLDMVLAEVRRGPQTGLRAGAAASPRCVWDMSLTSMLRWRSFRRTLGTSQDEADATTRRLLCAYEQVNTLFPFPSSFFQRASVCVALEKLVSSSFTALTNSFLINCHTKVPCVDTVFLFESISVFTMMLKANLDLRITYMLEEFSTLRPDEPVAQSYVHALSRLGIADSPLRRRAYRQCCESVPLLLVICALGALLTRVSFENCNVFDSSLSERLSMRTCCVPSDELPSAIPQDRLRLSEMLVCYALMIQTIFPNCMKENTLVSVQYRILLSQYYLYTMNPLLAHREIILASTQMMYYLQKARLDPQHKDSLSADRLFWTCLKLECELRSELSPYVPLSGITQIEAPAPFLKLPELPKLGEHLSECVRIASRYDDKNSWLFFLTEVAVRKLDNLLFDDLYSLDERGLWDLAYFANTRVWQLVIKYLNQYNSIIASLTPEIRNFVMSEENVDLELKRMVHSGKKRKRVDEPNYLDSMDAFLLDDGTLLEAQSELVMFIKTRILTSKLALFRPLVYLVLEDKILIHEIVRAAAAVMGQIQKELNSTSLALPDSVANSHSSQGSTFVAANSGSQPVSLANFVGEDMPHYDPNAYQQKFPDEDFSSLVEYPDGFEVDDDIPQITNLPLARQQLLRVFVRNFVTLPKLNVPSIWLHRHAGSWYYIRNFFFGAIVQFLLYKKIQLGVANMMVGDPRALLAENMGSLSSIFTRERTKDTLELALHMMKYWKDELKDCEVYIEYLQRCFAEL